jgi:DNA-binding NarL/FixJ family response regulator
MSEPIRILIVDDHPVVRAGLTSMLSSHGGFDVCGAACGGEEAIEMVELTKPDVILLDLRMGDMSGIDTLVAFKSRQMATRVLVLTSFETDEDIYRAVQAGALGYLMKDTSLKEMAEAIQTVYGGRKYFSREIASRLAERMMRSSLTTREVEVLKLLAKGPTNKQIARALCISDHTVRNHVNNILEKLDVSDRTEAATTAIQRGIIEVDN